MITGQLSSKKKCIQTKPGSRVHPSDNSWMLEQTEDWQQKKERKIMMIRCEHWQTIEYSLCFIAY